LTSTSTSASNPPSHSDPTQYNRRSVNPLSLTPPSRKSPLSRSTTESTLSGSADSREVIKSLVADLGSQSIPEIHFLSSSRDVGTVGEIIKQAAELAVVWKKKRTSGIADVVDHDRRAFTPGITSRRGSAPSEAGSLRSSTSPPVHTRTPSMEYQAPETHVKDKRSTMLSRFPSALSFTSLPALAGKDLVEPNLASNHTLEPDSKTRTFDVVLNFLSQDERPDSFQSSLQNLLVTTTAILPHMPSALRISAKESVDEKKRRNSVYTLDSTAGTSSSLSSRGTPPSSAPSDVGQTLIHVLPVRPSPPLIMAAEKYLKSLFPQPDWDTALTSSVPRAYVLGNKVLGQPMQRAINMAPISGLAMILSGAVSCRDRLDEMYLDDFKSCRFDSDVPDRPSPEQLSTPGFDQYTIVQGNVDPIEAPDLTPPEIRLKSDAKEGPGQQRAYSPSTPPLDYEGETSASSVANSTLAPSVDVSDPTISIAPSHPSPTSQIYPLPSLKKKKSGWLGKLFSKNRTAA
jgi:hypothetical protein